jgi:UDP-glucose 4-epimerase
MSKILITGVAGLVGSNLANKLKKDNHVVGVDNFIGGYLDNLPQGIDFLNLDCVDLKDEHFLGVDIVIHAACTPHEGLSIFSPVTITQNTYMHSVNVLKCSINAGVKKFIFTSSMARYGKQDIVPFTEDMIPKPQDPYGVAKYAFEQTLKTLSDVHGIEYTILIPHNIIGPGQVYTDPFRNVAGIMINRMLQGKQPVIYGDGKQMRCFSDIKDVIDPIVKVVETDIANSQTINIGPDSNYITIFELAKTIADEIGFDLDPIYLPGRPAEVKHANCSANRARDLLGYNPQTNLNDTIKDMINWVKQRGPRDFDFSLPIEIVSNLTPKTWTDHSVFNS